MQQPLPLFGAAFAVCGTWSVVACCAYLHQAMSVLCRIPSKIVALHRYLRNEKHVPDLILLAGFLAVPVIIGETSNPVHLACTAATCTGCCTIACITISCR